MRFARPSTLAPPTGMARTSEWPRSYARDRPFHAMRHELSE